MKEKEGINKKACCYTKWRHYKRDWRRQAIWIFYCVW